MDPATIVQVVGVAVELASICVKTCGKIYEFGQEVRTIDRTLTRVEDEVKDIERILMLVRAALSDPAVKRTGKSTNGEEILKAVNSSVERSRYILTTLSNVLNAIIGDTTGRSTIVALRQAVRSKRKAKDLDECIALIDKSKQNLNVGLTTLAVFMVANSAAYRRTGKESEIEPLTKQLETALKEHLPPNQAADAESRREDDRVRRTAKNILSGVKSPHPGEDFSRASTLLPAGDGNEAVEDDGVDLQVAMREWMSRVNSAKLTRRASLNGKLRAVSSFESMNAVAPDPSSLVEPPNEKFQIRTVHTAIKQGNEDYSLGKKEQALAKLQQALQDAMKLSKAACIFIERDLIEVRLHIAELQVNSRESQLDEAEEHLLQAILAVKEDKRSADVDMQQSLAKANQILAKVYLMQRSFEEAEAYCLDSLNVQIYLGDESSSEYWRTRQLLIGIYHGMENTVKVTMHMDELRDEWKESTNSIIFGQGQQSYPGSPRPLGPNSPRTRTQSNTGLGLIAAQVESEFMPRLGSQRSHSTNNSTSSPVFDQNIFERDPEKPRTNSHVEPPSSRDVTDNIAMLAEGGFKDDFDAQDALDWAIREQKIRLINCLLSGLRVTRRSKLGGKKEVNKQAALNGTKRKAAPLFTALTTPGCIMIARRLLDLGASTKSEDKDGRSLLEAAARQGSTEAISVLVDHGVTLHSDEGIKAYHLAAQHGNLDVLRLFIERKFKPDEREPSYNRTVLHWAALKGHNACVDFLICNGADPNSQDHGNTTPLMGALRERHASTVQLLLRYFANANLTNSRGQSALIIAAEHGLPAMARMLLEDSNVPVKLDLRDHSGWTALIWACSKKYIEVAEVLLEHGANVNAQCDRGSRALDHIGYRQPVLYTLLRRYNAMTGSGVSRRGTIDDTFNGYVFV